MPLIQLLVQDEHRDGALDVLRENDIDFVVQCIERQESSLVSFPVPPGAVEEVFENLRDADLDTDEYAVISDLDGAKTPNFEELEKKFTEEPEAESRISHEELRTTARDLEASRVTFIAQTILSATVAAGGLLLNSAIVIVGSMVLSPFTTSLLSVALGVIIDDRDLFTDSLKSQLIGLSLAIFMGLCVGLFVQWGSLIPPTHSLTSIKQIRDFSSPNVLVITIAIAAGSASAFALSTDEGVTLIGVAIAAALIPSAATTGLGLAWRQFSIALGAFELLIINVLSINITSFVTFLLLGYRPSFLERSS